MRESRGEAEAKSQEARSIGGGVGAAQLAAPCVSTSILRPSRTPHHLRTTPGADAVAQLDDYLEAEAAQGPTGEQALEQQALEQGEVHRVYYKEGQALTRAHIWRDGT